MAAIDTLVDAASDLLGERVDFVRSLSGGTHAETAVVKALGRELVVRRFPAGDDAVAREVPVLNRIGLLGECVPELVAHRLGEAPLIVTSKVRGSTPGAGLDPAVMAVELGRMLAMIHAIDPAGLPDDRARWAAGAASGDSPSYPETPIARAARRERPRFDPASDVLVHSDYWCGNAMWHGDRLVGIVDWSSASSGSRGSDVAWCRQDLVLLGAPHAADVFVDAYERASGERVIDLRAWDLAAAARAERVVESWAPNYAGIGRGDLTADVLRVRLDAWNSTLL